jgi:hypothetical protein
VALFSLYGSALLLVPSTLGGAKHELDERCAFSLYSGVDLVDFTFSIDAVYNCKPIIVEGFS